MSAAPDPSAARTLLFVPGNRPDRFAKAVAAKPDGIILDLEDAVAPAQKDAARQHVADWLANGNSAVVRINDIATPWFDDDLLAIGDHRVTVVLPKVTSSADASEVVGRLGAGSAVIALLETAAGILNALNVCATPGVVRAAFGSVDLGAELGINPADRPALAHARSTVVLASAAAGIAPPLDGVTADLTSPEAARSDARYAAELGFSGKLCIHPMQIEIVNTTFAPSLDEIAWARGILSATQGTAAVMVDGQMVDKPVLERARRILARTPSR